MAPGIGHLINQCMHSLLIAKQSYSSHQPLAFYFEIFINLYNLLENESEEFLLTFLYL